MTVPQMPDVECVVLQAVICCIHLNVSHNSAWITLRFGACACSQLLLAAFAGELHLQNGAHHCCVFDR
jgi:hypothetical protein